MGKAKIHQVARKIHRWLSLIVGAQLFLWTLSGLFMASNSIERVRSDHIQQKPNELDLSGVAMNIPAELSALRQLKKLQLVSVAGGASWLATTGNRTEPLVLFDAKTGQKISPLPEKTIRVIARQDYAGPGELKSLEKLEDAISSDFRGPFPTWVATFTEPANYRIYVDPNSGQILARRSQLWRIYDWLWMLHIMDYEEHENFNNWLLIIASAFALATSVSGLLLLFFVFRRSDFQFSWAFKKPR